MTYLWNVLIYKPIYNALVFITTDITFGNVALAIIILTILIKLILSPLSKKSIRSQVLMKKIEPELKQIKKDYPNKEEQAKKTFELYKKYNTNPFSGCLVVLIQMPVIFALYYVFYRGLNIDPSLVYGFIDVPTTTNTMFLGFIDLHSKSIILGILAGLTQFIQGYLSSPIKPRNEIVSSLDNQGKNFQDQLSDSMQMNVKYILPVFIAFIAWKISAAVALYWVVNNIYTILQEWNIRRKVNKNLI